MQVDNKFLHWKHFVVYYSALLIRKHCRLSLWVLIYLLTSSRTDWSTFFHVSVFAFPTVVATLGLIIFYFFGSILGKLVYVGWEINIFGKRKKKIIIIIIIFLNFNICLLRGTFLVMNKGRSGCFEIFAFVFQQPFTGKWVVRQATHFCRTSPNFHVQVSSLFL